MCQSLVSVAVNVILRVSMATSEKYTALWSLGCVVSYNDTFLWVSAFSEMGLPF